jgi:hypothetical protein
VPCNYREFRRRSRLQGGSLAARNGVTRSWRRTPQVTKAALEDLGRPQFLLRRTLQTPWKMRLSGRCRLWALSWSWRRCLQISFFIVLFPFLDLSWTPSLYYCCLDDLLYRFMGCLGIGRRFGPLGHLNRIQCSTCHKTAWAGCGMHTVPIAEATPVHKRCMHGGFLFGLGSLLEGLDSSPSRSNSRLARHDRQASLRGQAPTRAREKDSRLMA